MSASLKKTREMSKRVLISTQVFPPMTSGSAMILYELLKHLPQDELVAVHGISDPPFLGGPSLGMDRHTVLMLGSYVWTLRCVGGFRNYTCP